MTDLEVFQLSAMACGYSPVMCFGAVWTDAETIPAGRTWEPFTNASQRWECVKKLLEHKFAEIELCVNHNHSYTDVLVLIELHCSADEFPARALAELEARKMNESKNTG